MSPRFAWVHSNGHDVDMSKSPTIGDVLRLALPIMVSNLSTPLLGLVDTAVVGRLPDPMHIGAVAVGALIFSFVFWGFSFLRMGTTGMTAQAVGAENAPEVRATLGRALLVAVAGGLLLFALQWPIRALALHLLHATEDVERLAGAYFDARIWSAPATLVNYALLGWFIGRGRTDLGLVLQLVLNLSNMALDALFVLEFDWGVRGVGIGTSMAEYIAAGVGLVVAWRLLRADGGGWVRAHLLDAAMLRRTFAVNRDITIRSLSLVGVFVFFMAKGAERGDLVLAANAVLMQFINTSAYFLDGLAFAAESLVGRALGAKRPDAFRLACWRTTLVAVGVAALLSLALFLFGGHLVDVLTLSEPTRVVARRFLPWAAMAPLMGVWCFQLDGIFIGATRTREMRTAMLGSLAIFLAAWWLLQPLANHGLWLALHVHYVARTASLGIYLRGWRRWFEPDPPG